MFTLLYHIYYLLMSLLSKHQLSTYYVPGTFIGAENTTEGKRHQVLLTDIIYSEGEKETKGTHLSCVLSAMDKEQRYVTG